MKPEAFTLEIEIARLRGLIAGAVLTDDKDAKEYARSAAERAESAIRKCVECELVDADGLALIETITDMLALLGMLGRGEAFMLPGK